MKILGLKEIYLQDILCKSTVITKKNPAVGVLKRKKSKHIIMESNYIIKKKGIGQQKEATNAKNNKQYVFLYQ